MRADRLIHSLAIVGALSVSASARLPAQRLAPIAATRLPVATVSRLTTSLSADARASSKHSVLIGAAIGATGGALIAFASTRHLANHDTDIIAYGFWIPTGAAVDALVGYLNTK